MLTSREKKDLTIFISVTLGLTIIMSLFIPKCYEINGDAVLFTNIQAYFPMTGVIIVLLYNMRKKAFRLKSFFILFLSISGIAMCSGVATLFLDYNICMAIENMACRIGSLLSLLLIFYLSDPFIWRKHIRIFSVIPRLDFHVSSQNITPKTATQQM